MTRYALAEPTVEHEVFKAWRRFVARALQIDERDVGSWEIVSDARAITLALYAYKGAFTKRSRMFGTTDAYVAHLAIRSGSAPIAENEMYARRVALATALTEFTHPALAGITIEDWSFDTGKNNGQFTNVLELSGKITFTSRPVHLFTDPAPKQVAGVDLLVRQADD